MHRINVNGKMVLGKMERNLKSVMSLLGKHAGQIGYYACVALVLTAVAVAAERYRGGGDAADALVLPAVELATPAPKEEEAVFQAAEEMTMLRQYSDQPEWNSVHAQWETHVAVDYTCPDGLVSSLSDGVVKTVGKSGVYGGFLEVETGEYLVRYASIAPDEELLPGEAVKKGDRLGMTDDSMPGEAHMGAHLHLELCQNGSCLDFAKEYAKKLQAVD